MFEHDSIPYWAHEVAKPMSCPTPTEEMLIDAHMLTEEEENAIHEMARESFESGPVLPRSDRGERFEMWHAIDRMHGDLIISGRLARIQKRHPVCTNLATAESDDGLPLTRKATV